MNVLLFAGLKEKVGERQIILPVEDAVTAEQLRAQVYAAFPQLEGDVFQIACNEAFVKGSHVIAKEDEVALIPPVSGG